MKKTYLALITLFAVSLVLSASSAFAEKKDAHKKDAHKKDTPSTVDRHCGMLPKYRFEVFLNRSQDSEKYFLGGGVDGACVETIVGQATISIGGSKDNPSPLRLSVETASNLGITVPKNEDLVLHDGTLAVIYYSDDEFWFDQRGTPLR